MEQKVFIFEEDSRYELESEINKFIKDGYKIDQISYAVSTHGYTDYYSCMVVAHKN